jgi:octaprenyl-diphosphate synthase
MRDDLKQSILNRVAEDLAAIESALSENLRPYLELVSDIARHILFSGGKRLRPLLMVISARLCGYAGRDTHKFATIFEYLHAATLLHDDLVDGAAIRRGRPVAHAIWDNSSAVLVGDFLLARSLTIAAETGRPRIIRVIAEITENMSQGEIHQLLRKGDIDLTEAEYREVIRRKTAVLFDGACRASAILADVAQAQESALGAYGLNLGLAFQMADDLLDYTADSTTLGKPVGADLREGKLTLPIIHALQNAGDGNRERMLRMVRDKDFSPAEFKTLVDLLDYCGSLDYTRRMAAEHIRQAKQALAIFDPCPARELLLDIADYALARKI